MKKMIVIMSVLCYPYAYGAEKRFKISFSTPKNSPKGSPKNKSNNSNEEDVLPSKAANSIKELKSEMQRIKETRGQSEKK